MLWINKFDQSYRPTILDMRNYFTPQVMSLLETLNTKLFHEYRVKATPANYTKSKGWVFPYRLWGVTMFSLAIHDETNFIVGDLHVTEQSELDIVLEAIDKQYHSGFSQHAEKVIRARKERARLRGTAHNISQERLESPYGGSDLEKLNKYHWIPALSPSKLRELYRSSAAGMLNLELLDDIGIQFYLRCLQGVEEYQLIRTDQLKCHQCGTILPKEDGLMICSCGYQYTFQEYIRSFNNQRMPGGSALHVFQDYVEKWPSCRSDTKKMLLIDWMIHQCHISMSSGLPLRSVLKNLIDAPQKTAEKLILELAYDERRGV